MVLYEPHEIANLFPSSKSNKELEDNIKLGGYDKDLPIILFEDKILDGRHRQMACKVVGVEPTYTTFVGTYKEAVAKAIRLNIRIKESSAGQRAAAASDIANLKHGQRGDYLNDRDTGTGETVFSLAEACTLIGIRKTAVDEFRYVQKHAPALALEVRAGTLGITPAKEQATRLKDAAEAAARKAQAEKAKAERMATMATDLVYLNEYAHNHLDSLSDKDRADLLSYCTEEMYLKHGMDGCMQIMEQIIAHPSQDEPPKGKAKGKQERTAGGNGKGKTKQDDNKSYDENGEVIDEEALRRPVTYRARNRGITVVIKADLEWMISQTTDLALLAAINRVVLQYTHGDNKPESKNETLYLRACEVKDRLALIQTDESLLDNPVPLQ